MHTPHMQPTRPDTLYSRIRSFIALCQNMKERLSTGTALPPFFLTLVFSFFFNFSLTCLTKVFWQQWWTRLFGILKAFMTIAKEFQLLIFGLSNDTWMWYCYGAVFWIHCLVHLNFILGLHLIIVQTNSNLRYQSFSLRSIIGTQFPDLSSLSLILFIDWDIFSSRYHTTISKIRILYFYFKT